MRMADLLDPPKSVLLLHTVDGRLNRCIRGAVPFRKGFLNLADGAGTLGPQHLHYRELQLGKSWRGHKFRSIWVMLLYECVFCKPFFWNLLLASLTQFEINRLRLERSRFGERSTHFGKGV